MNAMKPLKALKKLPALTTLPNLQGKRERRTTANWDYVSAAKQEFDPTSDIEDRLARELKSRPLAKRVVKLQQEHPYGTVPELLALDYLQAKKERYTYQAQLWGGWRKGGLVPDFVVHRPGGLLALLINGNYWHPHPQKNEADKLRLKGGYYEGERITKAIIVWESAILRNRDMVMEQAMSGVEMGP